MKKGIASSVFVNYPINEVINLIDNAGFRFVDIWGGRPHVYRKDYSSDELKSLRLEIEGRGMHVSSFMPAFFRYPHNLCSPNSIVVQDTLDYVFQSMDNAVELGAPLLLVCPPRLLFGQDAVEAWDMLAKNLQLICERAHAYGIRITLEPVNKQVFDLINSVADAMRMIQYVNCDNLGIILDSGHLYLSDETIEQALTMAADRLFQIHVSDNDGKKQQNLIPGDGTFDFDRFFKQLRKIKYDGVVSAELGGEYALDPIPAMQETARRISRWLSI